MKTNPLRIILILISFIFMQQSLSHTLPSHFADHSHSDPKFERPNIRLRNQNQKE